MANSNSQGIHLQSSSSNNNQIINNTFNSNYEYGIYLDSSSNNNFTSNILTKNRNVGYMDDYTNNFTSNQFLKNLNSLSTFSTLSQNGTTSNRIDFNITMKYVNSSDCPSCSYKLDLYPSESSFKNSSNGALILGNFTPAKIGIYSLKINITDENNNSEIRKYIYLINATKTDLVNYYFRSTEPTHGQPTSYGWLIDSGSLLFDKPTSAEDRHCGVWVQFSPDVLPDYLFGIYKQINYSIWYQTGAIGYTGVQRYASYDNVVDYSTSVSATSKTFETFNFTVDLVNDYFWSWYWMSIKLYGSNPYIYTNSTDPSYANITYSYSNTPAIKEISNEDVQLLSAFMDSNTSITSQIILEGDGTTNLSVKMPNSSLTYFILYGGVNCSNVNCTLNSQSNGEINLTLVLGSEHTLIISNDSVAPTVTLTSPANGASYTGTTYNVNFTFSVTDDSDISSCSAYVSGTEYTNTTAVTKAAINGINVTLNAGSYSAYVNCTDVAGNTGNSLTISFTITAPASSTSPSSGGVPTYYPTETQLEEGYTKSLGKNWKIKFEIGSETYELKIDNVGEDSVKITISGEAISFELGVNESKKIDIDKDNWYDLFVKLNKINWNKADIEIKKIYEEVPEVLELTGGVVGVEGEQERDLYVLAGILSSLIVVVGGGLVWFVFRKKGKENKKE